MGAGASSSSNSFDEAAKRHSLQEFTNVCPEGKKHLVLSQVRQLQSIEGAPMDMCHLPTLWMLDSNHDGLVTLEEVTEFAKLCGRKAKEFRAHEFQMQMQGYCTLCMFDAASVEGGVESFVRWFSLLFSEGVPFQKFDDFPDVEFTTRDAAHLMHELLQIDDNYGYSAQKFFDVAQHTGEELGIMTLLDERLDELVPVEVVETFSRAFIEGLLALMKDLHFKANPPTVEHGP